MSQYIQWTKTGFLKLAILALASVAHNLEAAESGAALQSGPPGAVAGQLNAEPAAGIWADGIGQGFRPSAQSLTVSAGASIGVPILGGQQHHDLALSDFSYGRVLGPALGRGHWYGGNLEGRAELFAGGQFSPDARPLVGLTPHIRYDFATGTRWVPFFDLGAGVTATGIGPPDLSGTFEFNLQGSLGASYFLRPDFALTGDARLVHLSCAGISSPNLGLNTILGTVGLSWYF